MVYTASVTQKGQVTIPKAIRDQVGIKLRGVVQLQLKGSTIVIEPAKDILDLAGSVKAVPGKSALRAREYMENNYRRG